MAQKPFNLSNSELYVECHRPFKLPNGKYSGMIRVYELLHPEKQNMLTTMDWSFEPVIVDPNATTGYNSLEIDGQLVDLEKLVQDLCRSRLRVNRLGYCYFQVRQGVADTTETYGFAFYRMNDVLKWSDYGVDLKQGKPNLMTWDRLDILHGGKSDSIKNHQECNDDQTTMINQLESQNQKLTDEVKELKAQLSSCAPLKSQNRELTDQIKELQGKLKSCAAQCANTDDKAVIDQLKSQNQILTDQNKVLEAQLYRPFFVSVSPILFNIIRSYNPMVRETILHYWVTNFNNTHKYTPTRQAVRGELFYKRLSFAAKHDQGFDTNNWYSVAVKELEAPILIYEGTAYSANVAGHVVSAPVEGGAYVLYNAATGEYDRPFYFGLILLNNVGARIGIRLW
ncbi:hypothetical protein vseg_017593 [Gypsophila vaccaria]